MHHRSLRFDKLIVGGAAAFALLSASSSALAVTYNVGASRMFRTPCALIQSASVTLRPGDVIEVDSGTYNDSCRVELSGAAGMPLTLRGVGATRPILDGTGLPLDGDAGRARAILQFSGANHWVVENLELRNGQNAADNAAAIRVTEFSTNITLRNLNIHDSDNGVSSDTGAELVIEDSEIYRNGTGTMARVAGHNLFLAGNTLRVQGCSVRDSVGGENVRLHMNHALVLYNEILRGATYDIDIAHNYKNERSPSQIIMIGNIIARSPMATNTGESIVFGIDSTARGTPNTQIFMYNNLFSMVSGANRLLQGEGPMRGTIRLLFHNNVVYGPGGSGLTNTPGTDALIAGSNNWIRTGIAAPATLTRTVTGADPLWTSATDLTPRMGSPLIDAGATPPTYPDVMGVMVSGLPSRSFRSPSGTNARTIMNAVDIGPYEGVSTPTPVDTDGDGLTDDVEMRIGTNPMNPDTDGDGLTDGQEVPNPAAPRNTDGDTLIDALDPDDDGDGIPTRSERPGGMNRDTDMDGAPDHLDPDDDNDGQPTSTERPGMMDRNTDGDALPDHLDPDDDGDGLPTTEERPGMMDRDTDMDMRPDHLDPDDDGDTIPTAVERRQDTTAGGDFDRDMRPSYLDTDSDGDTVPDREEAGASPMTPADTDMDGAPDYLDLDSDNDCRPDAMEPGAARITRATDPNANCSAPTPVCDTTRGVCVTSTADTDMDGVPDDIERRIGTNPMNPDTDGDGIRDGDEIGMDPTRPRDTDGDMMIDANDPDDDGDGVPTRDERPGMMNRDTDGDMVPDHLDADDDGDGQPTRDERPGNMDRDTDGDMTPDYLEPDDDGDGIPTRDERPGMMNRDTDSDMVPDHLDADDDNDTVPTRDERPMMMDRDSDMDMLPDHLDPDDDGEGIPTRVERMQDTSTGNDLDGDGRPSYLDLDSDGDTVPDREEAGAAPATPVDTDMDGAPDYLDRDSDNDCLPDQMEPGTARITRAVNPDDNCSGATPVCDTNRGLCVARGSGDGGVPDAGDAGNGDAGNGDASVPGDACDCERLRVTGDGCGCGVVGAGDSSDLAGAAVALGLVAVSVARRRRRRVA
ncbi:MAG: MYXO-CTERM sorting domain-containing protein [Polyangiales bacterium]